MNLKFKSKLNGLRVICVVLRILLKMPGPRNRKNECEKELPIMLKFINISSYYDSHT